MKTSCAAALAATLMGLAAAAPAQAQPASPPAAGAPAFDAEATVTAVERLITERYVYPERRAAIVAGLETARRGGAIAASTGGSWRPA